MPQGSTLFAADAVGAHDGFGLQWQNQIWPQRRSCEEASLHEVRKHVRLIRDSPVKPACQTSSLLQHVRVLSVFKLGRDDFFGQRVLPLEFKAGLDRGPIALRSRVELVHDKAVKADAEFLTSENCVHK